MYYVGEEEQDERCSDMLVLIDMSLSMQSVTIERSCGCWHTHNVPSVPLRESQICRTCASPGLAASAVGFAMADIISDFFAVCEC